MPRLPPQDPVEPRLRTRRGDRSGVAVVAAAAHVLDGERVGALVLPDLAQQAVGVGVPGGALVKVPNLVVLGRLACGQEPVDRGDPRLQAHPRGDLHAVRVGDRDAELVHPALEAPAVAALGLGHLAHDLGAAVVEPLGDQLVDTPGLDLPPPRLEEAITHLRVLGLVGHCPT